MKTNSNRKPTASGTGPTTARKGVVLGPRDAAILSDVYDHTLVLRAHVQEAHFGSVPRANARLKQLVEAGYLHRHYGPFGAGQAFYALGPAAVPLLAAVMGIDTAVVKQRVRAEFPISRVAHLLKIKDTYLAVRRAVKRENAAQGSGEAGEAWHIEVWKPEVCHRYEFRAGPAGEFVEEAFRPDAALLLARSQSGEYASVSAERHLLFVEVDLATVSRGQFTHKIETALRFMASPLVRSAYGSSHSVRLLVLTPSTARRDYLRGVVRESVEGADIGERVWFSTFPDVESGDSPGFLGPVWMTPEDDTRSLCTDVKGES